MPTAAPSSVSSTRPRAYRWAPPTASTSMAVMGTSSSCGPKRSSRPATRLAATTRPRLHQVSPTKLAKTAATSTPATTLTTRSRPEASVSCMVSWTTSRAVSGASTGAELVCSQSATA